MSARFNKIINMFVREHYKNSTPNTLLFGALGTGYGCYNYVENEVNLDRISRKLDMDYHKNKSPVSGVFGMMQSGISGGAVGATYGYFAGHILFPALVIGLTAKCVSNLFKTAEN